MKILIAEDDRLSRRILEEQLIRWGYEVVSASDGIEAWFMLQSADAPPLAILDWMMPEMSGLEICREVRQRADLKTLYIVMLTAKDNTESIVQALQAGADDYVVKSFQQDELRARIQAGVRIIEIRNELSQRIRDLQVAHVKIMQLQSLLPICSYCRRIRNEELKWQTLEDFISTHSDTKLSHGICPDCYESILKPEIEELIAKEGLQMKNASD